MADFDLIDREEEYGIEEAFVLSDITDTDQPTQRTTSKYLVRLQAGLQEIQAG